MPVKRTRRTGSSGREAAVSTGATEPHSPGEGAPCRSLEQLVEALHEFVLVLNTEGVVQSFWSSNRKRVCDLETALLGHSFWDFVRDETVARIARLTQRAVESGERIYEMRHATFADGDHCFSVSVAPVAAKPGGPKNVCLLARDVTPGKASHDALILRESLLAQAEQLANVGSWEEDLETHTLHLSEHLLRMVGLPRPKEAITRGFGFELVHPDDRERAVRDAEAVSIEGTPVENELRVITPHRGVRIFRYRAIAIRDGDGRIVRVRGMSQDVTEQREAEDKLREREALLAEAEEVAHLGSYHYDLIAETATLSPNLRRLYGVDDAFNWRAVNYFQCVHPEERQAAQDGLYRAMKEGRSVEMRLRFFPPGGGGMRVHVVRSVPVTDARGQTLRRVGVVQDITEQHQADEKLREQEALLEQAEKIANFGSWEYEFATQKATLSPNMRKILGLGPGEEWTAEGYWSRMHPEDRERAQAIRQRSLEERKPFEYEARFLWPEGGTRFIHVRAVPTFDLAGKPVRIVGVMQDVTERHEADKKLREHEALLAQAEQLANMGSYRYDHGMTSVMPSANLSRICGFAPDSEWTRAEFWERVHPDDRAWAHKIVSDSIESKQPFDFVARYMHPERGLRHLLTRGVAIPDASGDEFRRLGVMQDVTERHEAEEKIREHEALMTNAEQVANFGLWQYDMATQKIRFSPKMRELYGLGDDEEWSSESCWERVYPEDRARVRESMARGTEATIPFEFVMRFTPMGGSLRYFHVRGGPQIDSTGRVVRSAGIAQDITDRVHSEEELRRLSQQLMRARDDERRQIARDLHETAGQSLAALKMSLGRLRDTMPEADDLPRALLRSASELADAAVREIRTISYLMYPPMLDEAGLAPALRWYVRGFADRSGIRVQADIPESLPRHSQEIETTIFRIVQEALTNVHRYSGSQTAHVAVACKDGEISAEVRDEGRGIAFPIRTWSKAEALGVGIAGMRERVQQLNGIFEIESAAGKGTTVRVTLPANPGRANRGSEVRSPSGGKVPAKHRTKSHGA